MEISGALINSIAKMCHEVNKAYCEALGDISQVSWEMAPPGIQESAVNGVMFRLMNPDSTPEDQHNMWLAFKDKEGWSYGEVKDSAKKEHPCMVPYAKLPETQRAKDYIFRAIVTQMSALHKEEISE